MKCIKCNEILDDKSKFCNSCGHQIDSNIINNYSSSKKTNTLNDVNVWKNIGSQFKLWIELEKNKSPDALNAKNMFYKMLWSQRKLRFTVYFIFIFIALFITIEIKSKLDYQKTFSPVSIDANKFTYSQMMGVDQDGKKLEEWLLSIDGAKRIKLINANVFGKDISDSKSWGLLIAQIGSTEPQIICLQKTRDSKELVAGFEKPIKSVNFLGEYPKYTGNILYIENCLSAD